MTLTEVSYYSRKFAPVGIILILVILIMIFGTRLFLLYLNIQSQTPTQPDVTQVALSTNPLFGQIPKPTIPNSQSSALYTYILDTLDGTPEVEEATSAAEVYFIPQQNASFGFLSKIYDMAEEMGIDTSITEHQLQEKSAEFNDGKQKATIDIRNFNFSYNYTVTAEDTITENTQQSIESALTSQAASFLSSVDRYPTELSAGRRNVIYMRLDPASQQITTLSTPEGANMAEVDFYPQDLGTRPIVTSAYYTSPNFVVFLFSGTTFKPVRAQIRYFEKSIDKIGTYPLRTASQAWEDLQSGQGFVVSSGAPGGQVKIQKVFLAFYEPDVYQEYMQPVYVFLGENRFVAYVPAVSQEFLAQ